MKKLLGFLPLLVATVAATPSFAAADTGGAKAFGGVQIGLIGGMGFSGARINNPSFRYTNDTNVAVLDNPSVVNLGGRGTRLGAYVGYGADLGDMFYVGADVAYAYDWTKAQCRVGGAILGADYAPDIQYNYRKKDNLEIAGKFGLRRDGWMPYVRLGWASAKVVGTYTPSSRGVVAQKEFTYMDKRLSGLLVGFGIDAKVTPCLILGVEFSYKRFSNVTAKDNKNVGVHVPTPIATPTGPLQAPDGFGTYKFNVSNSERAVQFKLAYKM